MRLVTRCALTLLLFGLFAAPLSAGMGNPFPVVYERTYETITSTKLADIPASRLRALSFFVAAVLISSWGVQRLWNSLVREFPKLPQLSYGKSTAAVVLWGLLFVIVLTMISGARELMTPGVWIRNGFTYKLAEPPDTNWRAVDDRRRSMERLRRKLLEEVDEYSQEFLDPATYAESDSNVWIVPGTSVRYTYLGGSMKQPNLVIAHEPPMSRGSRFALFASGRILLLSDPELELALKKEREVFSTVTGAAGKSSLKGAP